MSEYGDYDWNDESTIIKQVDATAVYLNPDGDVVIRQQHPLGDDDAVIIIPIDRVQALTAALTLLTTYKAG